MTMLSVSISHHSASIDQLSQLSMPPEVRRGLARRLVGHEVINEALVLSTCNRTEIYVDADRFHAALDAVIEDLSHSVSMSGNALPELCSVRYDEAAVSHAFTMTSGLDSLVVGENQILGQVRAALSAAQEVGAAGPALNAAFQTALRVGKRVHSETAIGSAGRSVFSAAMDALESTGLDVAGRRVLVIGAGQMSGLAARQLAGAGARITCVNRTLANAERLAAEVGGTALPFRDLSEAVANHEIVVTCTGAGGRLVSASTLPEDAITRAIVDLALPADVDPDVRGRGVLLVNLASLGERLGQEQVDARAARELVDAELQRFLTRQRAAAVTPTVVALRQMADQVVASEIARLDRRLPGIDAATRAEITKTIHRVADKLMHQPTVAVRRAAVADDDRDVDYAAVLRTLFALEDAS